MAIDAKMVAQLREMTGAGIMDAKKALEEAGGNMDQAMENLRKSGVAKAAKKSERVTKEGRVYAYIHTNGKSGAMVEVLCETDFVARNEAFVELCKDLAMHVCASDPLYVRREQVPPEVVEKEKAIYKEELAVQGKPEAMMEKIVEGKLNKYFGEVCLMEQVFIKDDTKTVAELVNEKIAKIGENIQISRFCMFNIG